MSVSYFVHYRGSTAEAEAFIAYYCDVHGEFMRAYPGIRRALVHLPADWHDPLPIKPAELFLLAEFQFDDEAALDHALQSDARLRARDDAKKFPPFEGQITHQAMKTVVLF